MAINIPSSDPTGSEPSTCTQLRVVLPGGMVIQGSTPGLGSSPLEVARAAISAANGALAPLGPIFALLDVLMAVIDFAKSVPKVVSQPWEVTSALIDLVKKGAALASLVPQLSVPIMVLGIIDVIIAFLTGIQHEVGKLVLLEAKKNQVAVLVGDVPALGPIVAGVEAQIAARRSQVACAMGDAAPLLSVVSKLMKLIGLPPVELSGDPSAGALEDLASLLDTLVGVLTQIRSTIPV
jgi:hypothetical protein